MTIIERRTRDAAALQLAAPGGRVCDVLSAEPRRGPVNPVLASGLVVDGGIGNPERTAPSTATSVGASPQSSRM
jgi:hypothetical protein